MKDAIKKSYGYFRINDKYLVYDRANLAGGNIPKPLKKGHKHYLDTNVESVMIEHINKINNE